MMMHTKSAVKASTLTRRGTIQRICMKPTASAVTVSRATRVSTRAAPVGLGRESGRLVHHAAAVVVPAGTAQAPGLRARPCSRRGGVVCHVTKVRVSERLASTVPYLLPLFDGLKYGTCLVCVVDTERQKRIGSSEATHGMNIRAPQKQLLMSSG